MKRFAIAIALFGLALSVGGCRSEVDDQTLPLVAVDEDGSRSLAGVYYQDTREVWLLSTVSETSRALADAADVEAPVLLLMAEEDGATSAFDATDTTFVSRDLVQNEALRACVFEPSTGNRWTISRLEVGSAEDLDYGSHFVPTVLADEREPGDPPQKDDF